MVIGIDVTSVLYHGSNDYLKNLWKYNNNIPCRILQVRSELDTVYAKLITTSKR